MMCTTCGCSSPADVTTNKARADGTGRQKAYSSHRHDHHYHTHPHDADHAHDHVHTATVTLEEHVLAKNNLLAERNRGWFEGRNILALNVMSSPGAGKTTVLERTIGDLTGELVFSVIEGDQATVFDTERIRATGCRAVQINTGAGCHLEAQAVGIALQELDPQPCSVVMVENVGNLVCPALFDIGERARIVVLSVTEGEDKPLKYPYMFRTCELMLVNKIDLLPYVRFDLNRCIEYAQRINPDIQAIAIAATTGEGMDQWYRWLRQQAQTKSQGALLA